MPGSGHQAAGPDHCPHHSRPEPARFATAPVGAIQKLLDKTGWSVADIDLFEINEAFTVVTMAAMRELAIPHDKVNIRGGACAGPPDWRLRCPDRGVPDLRTAAIWRSGVASLCIGGGEATAIGIELI